MAFHVRDPETDRVVRELARVRETTLTEAIHGACAEALARDTAGARLSLAERLRPLQDYVASLPKTGLVADKAFYDSLSGEDE